MFRKLRAYLKAVATVIGVLITLGIAYVGVPILIGGAIIFIVVPILASVFQEEEESKDKD